MFWRAGWNENRLSYYGKARVAIATFLNSPTVWGFVRLELWPCFLHKFVSKRYTFKDKAQLKPKENGTD